MHSITHQEKYIHGRTKIKIPTTLHLLRIETINPIFHIIPFLFNGKIGYHEFIVEFAKERFGVKMAYAVDSQGGQVEVFGGIVIVIAAAVLSFQEALLNRLERRWVYRVHL